MSTRSVGPERGPQMLDFASAAEAPSEAKLAGCVVATQGLMVPAKRKRTREEVSALMHKGKAKKNTSGSGTPSPRTS